MRKKKGKLWNRKKSLTPTDKEENSQECLSSAEGLSHDDVEVQTLAEHPGEVGGRAILGQHVQHATPQLHGEDNKLQYILWLLLQNTLFKINYQSFFHE